MTSSHRYILLSVGIAIVILQLAQCATGLDGWSQWRYSMWSCQWERYNGRQEAQCMSCNCTSDPWSDWIPISLDPCEEQRSRGEVNTEQCWGWARRKRVAQVTTEVPLPPVFDCMETRPCENLSSLPCVDIPAVRAIVRLCASQSPLKMPTRQRIRNIGEWEAMCEETIKATECLQNFTQCTDSEAHALLAKTKHCFYTEMCDVGYLKPAIQTMLDDAAFDQGIIDAIDFTPCLELVDLLQEQLTLPALSCMRDLIENAGLTEPNNALARLMAQALINCTARIEDLGPTSEFYDFTSGRCTMRVYGEPHVVICNDTSSQTTCSAPGLQTYLDIFFLTVTGVNTQQRPPSLVTVLTEVTIEFKSLLSPNGITARYKADNGNLPAVFQFEDNSISAIDTVLLNHPGHRVELVWLHTGVIIIISVWNSFYQFTMRASQAVMNTGTGILIEGCPPGQALFGRRRRDIAEISKRDEDQASALATCLAVGVPANTSEMEACIIDVVVTNDTTIANATAMSIADSAVAVSKDAQAIQDAGVWSINIPMPVDGGWSNWSNWTRFRTCTKPAPAHGGADCEGNDTEIAGPGDCPVDGGWTDWGPWICGVTCGYGTGVRTRTCTNPPPYNGGDDCLGDGTETEGCYKGPCPAVIVEGPVGR